MSIYLSFSCLDSAAGVSASFGEMLLLVAMYFHSNQLSSIIELVCSTLGMKVRLREGIEQSVYQCGCPGIGLTAQLKQRHIQRLNI